MANQQIEAIKKELRPEAEQLAQTYIKDYATSLLLQAKMLAYRKRANVVLSIHVEEAKGIVESERKSSWSKELIIILGSTLFGAFIQEFIPKLSSGEQNYSPISIGFGIIGLLIVFWGLRRQEQRPQSMHPDVGSRRHFSSFFWLRGLYCPQSESTPAQHAERKTVSWLERTLV